MCSTAFQGLGRAQAKALGHAELPIAVIPHPFGIRTRDEVRTLAADCVDNIATLLCAPRGSGGKAAKQSDDNRAELIEAPDDLMEINQLFMRNCWSDGLPIIPPTEERVEAMLRGTQRAHRAAQLRQGPSHWGRFIPPNS